MAKFRAKRAGYLTNIRTQEKDVEPFMTYGSVVELVDALDSKSSARKGVGVRFSPEPPFVNRFDTMA